MGLAMLFGCTLATVDKWGVGVPVSVLSASPSGQALRKRSRTGWAGSLVNLGAGTPTPNIWTGNPRNLRGDLGGGR
jgi:hypothetical protein